MFEVNKKIPTSNLHQDISSYKIVIIGAGPAGVSAAIQCKRLGFEPLLIDKTGTAGGLISNANLVENYPALEASPGIKIAEKIKDSLSTYKIHVKHLQASHIKKFNKLYEINFTDNKTIHTQSIILAVGTKAKKLPETRNIHGLKKGINLFYDLRSLRKTMSDQKQYKSIIIVGGGEASFDYALSLLEMGIKPLIIVRSDKHKVSGILKERLESKKVEVLYNTSLGSIIDKVPYDAVMVAIGRESAIQDIYMDFDFKFEPSLSVSTNEPGIFIVGDARLASLGQMGIAVGDGLSAAYRVVKYLNSNDKLAYDKNKAEPDNSAGIKAKDKEKIIGNNS
jgi:thioredoxin reductase (NADPH)